MEPSADRANRRNACGRKLISEHLRSKLMQRICQRNADPARPVSQSLGAADDHHEQLIRPGQRHRRPCSHNGTNHAVTQAMRYVSRQGRRDPQAEEPSPAQEPAPFGAASRASPLILSRGAKLTIRVFSFLVQVSGSAIRGKSAAGVARLRGAAALAAPVGDRDWPGCRSAAAAPP